MSLDFYLKENGVEVFSVNITHNLGKMAARCGIYHLLWHPENETEIAGEAVEPLMDALALLKGNETFFRRFDAPNGWGRYEHFVKFVENVAKGCSEHRKATIHASI